MTFSTHSISGRDLIPTVVSVRITDGFPIADTKMRATRWYAAYSAASRFSYATNTSGSSVASASAMSPAARRPVSYA